MSDAGIKIRTANGADEDIVVAFNAAMARETEGKELDLATLRAGVRAALGDHAKCHYFVAEVGGVPAGQTMVTFEWSDWRNGVFWWIQSVYVEPKFRRRGVFRALHAYVRKAAQACPQSCGLRLYVHRANSNALKTYSSLGMAQTDYLVCEEDWTPHS